MSNKIGIARQSKASVEQKHKMIKRLLREYNYTINEEEFIEEFQKRLDEAGLDTPKDIRTYRTYIKDCEDDIKKKGRRIKYLVEKSGNDLSDKTNYSELHKILNDSLEIVLLKDIESEIVTYDIYDKTNKDDFYDTIDEKYNSKENNNDSLIHIFFIFAEEGYSNVARSFYKEHTEREILYTAIYDNCLEIVIRKEQLNSISTKMYYTIFGDEKREK